jgi:hypothetical protein
MMLLQAKAGSGSSAATGELLNLSLHLCADAPQIRAYACVQLVG